MYQPRSLYSGLIKILQSSKNFDLLIIKSQSMDSVIFKNNMSTTNNAQFKPILSDIQNKTDERDIINLKSKLHTSSVSSYSCLLNVNTVNPCIKQMEYAVRGPIVLRACELEEKLLHIGHGASDSNVLPFNEIIKCNIGDAQAMGQKYLTYFRQMLALLSYPQLMYDTNCVKSFPSDVIAKAQRILAACPGHSLGSYSSSAGIDIIRQDVAKFIERRDNIVAPRDGITTKCDFKDIFLSSGASEAIRNVLFMFKQPSKFTESQQHDCKKTGIMIPIPQYPLYSATITEYDMEQVGYYLNEEANWSLSLEELRRALEEGRKHCDVRVLCVINPGNPTGQILSEQNQKEIIQFAYDNKLFLLCDEVYQQNVYVPNLTWKSFRKVLLEDMPVPIAKTQEMSSFYSASKGFMGECGIRGGYGHFINVDPAIRDLYIKMISARLCPTTLGQSLMGAIVYHPNPEDPSGPLFFQERDAVLSSLKKKAKLVADGLNAVPGVKCNDVQGAMYAFPQITIPPKACALAKARGVQPDFLYALELLESEGLCVVPGSGFGQKVGTHHFRMTILPSESKMEEFMKRFSRFNAQFLAKYQ